MLRVIDRLIRACLPTMFPNPNEERQSKCRHDQRRQQGIAAHARGIWQQHILQDTSFDSMFTDIRKEHGQRIVCGMKK